MTESHLGLDLFGSVAAGAEGIARVMRKDAVSAVLFWGSHAEAEVVHRRDVPDDVCRALSTSGGRHIAEVMRASGVPLRLGVDALPVEATELRGAMRANGLASLAVFPLFGESGIAGCLVVPLEVGESPPDPEDESWRVACRVLEGMRLIAATAALEAALDQERRNPVELYDGVLVVDRWERVVFADGLFRAFPGWNREDPFGRALSSLPGGNLIAGLDAEGTRPLNWEDHLIPPIANHGVPVVMTAMPFGGSQGASEGGRIVFLRDMRSNEDAAPDGTARMLALGMRVAHGTDKLSVDLEAAKASGRELTVDAQVVARFEQEIDEARMLVAQVLDRCLSKEDRQQLMLNDLLTEVVERSGKELEQERVRVFSFLRPDLPKIPGDRLLLMRAFGSLVATARDSLRPGGGSLTIRSWSEDGWVYGAISDDGGGRSQESPPNVEPLFARKGIDNAPALADVRSVVEGMGGRLLVESRPGVWTRITVMLREERRRVPRRKTSEMPAAVTVTREGDGLSVLVVDDNAALRSVLRRYLERRGHQVTEAVDGEDGLRAVEGGEFDRVIVDIRMPVKDGPEFYQGLSGIAPVMQNRTIFMTGGFMEADTEDFIVGTGRPSIKKPFDLAEMARTLEG